ncbi:unnamed protein product [Gordionus sp. m RMFG-2023]
MILLESYNDKGINEQVLYEDKTGFDGFSEMKTLATLPFMVATDVEYVTFPNGHNLLAYIDMKYAGNLEHQTVNFMKVQDEKYSPMHCSVKTNRPLCLKSFFMKNSTYLFVGQDFDIINETQGSALYRITPSCDITHVHSIRSHRPVSIDFFKIGRIFCLAVANSGIKENVEIESYVYEWRGSSQTGHFDIFSSFVTYNARDVAHFKIFNNHYLAVANHHDNKLQVDVNSQILIYNLEEHTFNHFQYIPTSAASDWEFFIFGTGIQKDFFLVVANQYTYKDNSRKPFYRTNSVIYKFYRGSFILFQNLHTNGAKQFTAFQSHSGEFCLILTTLFGEISIYQYNGWKFFEVIKNPLIYNGVSAPLALPILYNIDNPRMLVKRYTNSLVQSTYETQVATSLIIVSSDISKSDTKQDYALDIRPFFVKTNPLLKTHDYMRDKLISLKERLKMVDTRLSNLTTNFESVKRDSMPNELVINITRSVFPSTNKLLERSLSQKELLEHIRKLTSEYVKNNTITIDITTYLTPELKVFNMTTRKVITMEGDDSSGLSFDDTILEQIQELSDKLSALDIQMKSFANNVKSAVVKSGINSIRGNWAIPKIECLNSILKKNYYGHQKKAKLAIVKAKKVKIGIIDRNLNLNDLTKECLNKTAAKVLKGNLKLNGGMISKSKISLKGTIDDLRTNQLISALETMEDKYSDLKTFETIYGNDNNYPTIFEGYKTIDNNMTINGNLIVDGTLNSIKFDQDNVIFSNKEQIIKGDFSLRNVLIKKLVFVGQFNDKNLSYIWNNAIPISDGYKKYIIKGEKIFDAANFQGPVKLGDPGVSTINGVNVVDFGNKIFTKNSHQTIKVPTNFLGQKTIFNGLVKLKGKLNNVKFPEDFIRLSLLNPQTPIILQGPVTFVQPVRFRNIITQSIIGNLDISKVFLTSRDEIIKNPVVFKNSITLKSDSYINGLMNGEINVTNIISNSVRVNAPQKIKSKYLSLKGNLYFKDNLYIKGFLNGKSLKDFLKWTVKLDDTKSLFEDPYLRLSFQNLILGDLSTPLIGDINLGKDLVVTNSQDVQHLSGISVAIGNMVLHNPHCVLNGKVNNEDWSNLFNNDTLLQDEDQIIKASKVFRMPVIFRKDLHLSGLLNNLNISNVMKVKDMGNAKQILFYDNVVLKVGLETKMLEVNGLLNGQYLDTIFSNSLKFEGDQVLTGNKIILGKNSVKMEDIQLDGLINSKNISQLARNVVLNGKSNQLIKGDKSFKGRSLVFNDIDIKGMVNGYRLKDLENILLNKTDQVIWIPVVFNDKSVLEGNILFETINNVTWDIYLDDFITINRGKDHIVQQHIVFDKIVLHKDIISADISKHFSLSGILLSSHLARKGSPIIFKQPKVRFTFEKLTFKNNIRIDNNLNGISIANIINTFQMTSVYNKFIDKSKITGNVKIEGRLIIENYLNDIVFKDLLSNIIPLKSTIGESSYSNQVFFEDGAVFNKKVDLKNSMINGIIKLEELLDKEKYIWKNRPCPIKTRLTFNKGLTLKHKIRSVVLKDDNNYNVNYDKHERLLFFVHDGLLNNVHIEKLKEEVWYNGFALDIDIDRQLIFKDRVIIKGDIILPSNARINDLTFKNMVSHKNPKHLFSGSDILVFTNGFRVTNDMSLNSEALIFGVNFTELISEALRKSDDINFPNNVTFASHIHFKGPVTLMGTLNTIPINRDNLLTKNDKQYIKTPLIFQDGLCCDKAEMVVESGLINDIYIHDLEINYLRSDKDNVVNIAWTVESSLPITFNGIVHLLGSMNGIKMEYISNELRELSESFDDMKVLKETSNDQCLALNTSHESIKNAAIFVENVILYQELRLIDIDNKLCIQGEISKILHFTISDHDYLLISQKTRCPITNCFSHLLYRRMSDQAYFHPFEVIYTAREARLSTKTIGNRLFIFASDAYTRKDIEEKRDNKMCSPNLYKASLSGYDNVTENNDAFYSQIYYIRHEPPNLVGLHLYQTIYTGSPINHKMFSIQNASLALNSTCVMLAYQNPENDYYSPLNNHKKNYKNAELKDGYDNDISLNATKAEINIKDMKLSKIYCSDQGHDDENKGFLSLAHLSTKTIEKMDFALIGVNLFMVVVYKSNMDDDINYLPPTLYKWSNFQVARTNQNSYANYENFKPFQHLRALGCRDVKFFVINSETYLAFVQSGKDSNSRIDKNLPLLIFKYQEYKHNHFDLVQTIDTLEASQVEFLSLDSKGLNYLLVLTDGVSKQTIGIYKYSGTSYFLKEFSIVLEKPTNSFHSFVGTNNIYIVTTTKLTEVPEELYSDNYSVHRTLNDSNLINATENHAYEMKRDVKVVGEILKLQMSSKNNTLHCSKNNTLN